jgi:hypothetical protein
VPGVFADGVPVAGMGALPFMRFSIPVIASTLKGRLMENPEAWKVAAPKGPYPSGGSTGCAVLANRPSRYRWR